MLFQDPTMFNKIWGRFSYYQIFEHLWTIWQLSIGKIFSLFLKANKPSCSVSTDYFSYYACDISVQ